METYRPDPTPTAALPVREATCRTTSTTPPPAVKVGGHGWQLPQANGSFWLLTVFTFVCAIGLMAPPPGLPTLQPIPAVPCPVPVELPGQGVSCLSAEAALRIGLIAGDVWLRGASGERLVGPPSRMAPRRLLAAQVRLDPELATAAELEALPDLGPQLAQRIVAARVERAAHGSPPLRTRAALLQISGLGPRRLQRLLPFLIALP